MYGIWSCSIYWLLSNPWSQITDTITIYGKPFAIVHGCYLYNVYLLIYWHNKYTIILLQIYFTVDDALLVYTVELVVEYWHNKYTIVLLQIYFTVDNALLVYTVELVVE